MGKAKLRTCLVTSCDNPVKLLSEYYCSSCKPEIPEYALGSKPDLKVVEFPLKPYLDLVFVKRSKRDQMVNGLYLPADNNDAKKTSGVVMAVGPGKWYPEVDRVVRPQVAVGDKVVFSRHANMKIDIEGLIPKDGEEYLVMHADELIALCTGDAGASIPPKGGPVAKDTKPYE